MQNLVGPSLARPIMHPSYRSTNQHFFCKLRSYMITICNVTGESLGVSISWGIFKMAAMNKKPKSQNRIFGISIKNQNTYTKFISKYIFLTVVNMIKLSKYCFLIRKGSRSKMAANFGPKIIHDKESINVLFSVMLGIKSNSFELVYSCL